MQTSSKIIHSATFNPKIQQYFLASGVLLLIISIIGIPLLLIWLLGLGQYVSRRFYENLECNLTERHLEFRKGVLFKIEKTIPLENIQDLTFIENPLLNYFDLRILKIETAGQSNPRGSDMKLIGIVNTQDFKDKVLRQRELLHTEDSAQTTSTGSQEEQIVTLLTDIKEILKDFQRQEPTS